MRVSVIIPTKNEEEGLAKILPELKSMSFEYELELLVIDDGSTDATASVAKEYGAKVVSHAYSKGNGAAIKTGAREASGDIFVFMDGDGQHQPSDIPRLLNAMSEGYDMVVGARSSSGQASGARWAGNALYNGFASWMVERKVEDLTSGFRAVDATKFKEFLSLLPNGFSYPTTITMAFFRSGYSVGYLPIKVHERLGKSHIRLFRDGLKFLLIIFKIGTLYSPLKLFTLLAAGTFSAGLAYYVYTYINFERFTNMSALLFTTSVEIFLFGLVAEQISTLYYKK
ncbi:glycosyltransferase family 2 protein [Pseudomaricurvus alkylphenolicus]|uniref:glycosyltransferase family 2 protein n=1 Tax=Pseudomaricurvus alkylphenolicus TaxID=1306991 RepID=UPI00141E4940|nr:glycosyltransferase family 2 protein [Pseudomaricurvus alkylphenolicus]NIB40032.1 glycosyltransferase family 2 protein [Pseudomaricurvus alkylphenolicus]